MGETFKNERELLQGSREVGIGDVNVYLGGNGGDASTFGKQPDIFALNEFNEQFLLSYHLFSAFFRSIKKMVSSAAEEEHVTVALNLEEMQTMTQELLSELRNKTGAIPSPATSEIIVFLTELSVALNSDTGASFIDVMRRINANPRFDSIPACTEKEMAVRSNAVSLKVSDKMKDKNETLLDVHRGLERLDAFYRAALRANLAFDQNEKMVETNSKASLLLTFAITEEIEVLMAQIQQEMNKETAHSASLAYVFYLLQALQKEIKTTQSLTSTKSTSTNFAAKFRDTLEHFREVVVLGKVEFYGMAGMPTEKEALFQHFVEETAAKRMSLFLFKKGLEPTQGESEILTGSEAVRCEVSAAGLLLEDESNRSEFTKLSEYIKALIELFERQQSHARAHKRYGALVTQNIIFDKIGEIKAILDDENPSEVIERMKRSLQDLKGAFDVKMNEIEVKQVLLTHDRKLATALNEKLQLLKDFVCTEIGRVDVRALEQKEVVFHECQLLLDEFEPVDEELANKIRSHLYELNPYPEKRSDSSASADFELISAKLQAISNPVTSSTTPPLWQ